MYPLPSNTFWYPSDMEAILDLEVVQPRGCYHWINRAVISKGRAPLAIAAVDHIGDCAGAEIQGHSKTQALCRVSPAI